MAKIVNCTPHTIVIRNAETNAIEREYEPANIPPIRVEKETIFQGVMVDGVSLVRKKIVGVSLPPKKEDTIYIVSGQILPFAVSQGRNDFVAPDTDNAMRNEKGHIIGVPNFTID